MDSTTKRKIGVIAWERFGFGGISRVVSNLIKRLSFDYDVRVLCLKREKFFQNVYKIDTECIEFTFMEMNVIQKVRRELVSGLFNSGALSSNFWIKNYIGLKYSSRYLNKFVSWIEQNDLDIILFSTGFEDCIQLAAIQPMLNPKRKLIAWSHAGFTDYFRNPKSKQFTKDLWKKYYSRFSAIVVLSDADVKTCKVTLGLKATRIYNPNSFFPQNRTQLNNKKFLYLGALSETKGSDILTNAFIEFASRNHEWSLSIYGDGAIKDWMIKQFKSHNLDDRVEIRPYTLDIEDVYVKHDIFVLPSRFEGFGVVQIEAASCGLPIISSDVDISKELIGKYHHGKLFERSNSHDLAKKMEELVSENLDVYSNNSYLAATDFIPEKIYVEWKQLIDNI